MPNAAVQVSRLSSTLVSTHLVSRVAAKVFDDGASYSKRTLLPSTAPPVWNVSDTPWLSPTTVMLLSRTTLFRCEPPSVPLT
ncbi:hypothetical protein D3C84_1250130 [compost metagenome]